MILQRLKYPKDYLYLITTTGKLMNYILCIDETGQFEHKKFVRSPFSVGGYVVKENDFRQLKTLRDRWISSFNNEYSREHPESYPVDQKHLHFRCLDQGMDRLRSNGKWPLSEDQGRAFIEYISKELSDIACCTCRTSGTPHMKLHPQHSYTACLLALIAGLVEDKDSIFTRGDSILVRISKRSKDVLTGKAYEFPDTYWELFTGELEKKLDPIGRATGISFSFDIGNARKDTDLQFADIVLGIQTNTGYRHLKEQFSTHIINVIDFYHVTIGTGREKILKDLSRQGLRADAIMLALDFLISNDPAAKRTGGDFLENEIINMHGNSTEDRALSQLSDSRFSELLAQRYQEPGILEKIRDAAEFVIKIAGKSRQGSMPHTMERCLHYLVEYEAHSGRLCSSPGDSYTSQFDKFFSTHGSTVYPCMLERMRTRLETMLISVQALYFNTFLFDELMGTMEKEISTYDKLFGNALAQDPVDDLYARICGTYGQACAFAGSVKGDHDMIREGRDYIALDIEHIKPGTIYYDHGLSFLASVNWELGDTRGMSDALSLMNGKDKHAPLLTEKLLNESPFMFLDLLRFAELCRRSGDDPESAAGIDTGSLCSMIKGHPARALEYPFNLIFKWTAVFAFRAGNKDMAAELLDLSLAQGHEESIFDAAFPLVNRMLYNAVRGDAPIDKNIWQGLERLGSAYPGFSRFLKERGITGESRLTVDEVARFLPFYYS